MATKPIPDGYHSVTPYLFVRDAARAIEFYKHALGAKELMRFPDPSGKVMHAEIQVGDSRVMFGEECPERGARGPETLGGTSMSLYVYVDNVDDRFTRAVAAGGKAVHPVTDQFYGDRTGSLMDPFGHMWTIATHKEDVEPAEIQRRMKEVMKQEVHA